MKKLFAACLAAAPIAAVAWGMGDREVIHEYDYPRRERVIEREKVIYKEIKHKDWEKCKDPKHHHPKPAPVQRGGQHQGKQRHGDQHHEQPKHHKK